LGLVGGRKPRKNNKSKTAHALKAEQVREEELA
jgi:hypothetical protein